ncbi:hypothetical protein BYT27DRAFT_7216011 [Phlegmacium glaucopus]|nr:hypothetical protein BYT27DRAFT_7216011 [Phlegmacium glaucopus]
MAIFSDGLVDLVSSSGSDTIYPSNDAILQYDVDGKQWIAYEIHSSACALSAEPVLLRHAERTGQILLPAFNGTESGLPAYPVNVETSEIFPDGNKRTVLFAGVETAMDVFYRANVTKCLFHDEWSMKDGKLGVNISPLALLPTVVTSTSNNGFKVAIPRLVNNPMEIINKLNNLVYQTPTRGLLYASDIARGSLDHPLEVISLEHSL